MINEYRAKRYCKEDLSKIENYDKAVNDSTQIWDLHHKTETWWNCTRKELIENECYYNRKACELIFLTHDEHTRLHQKGKVVSKDYRKKISESKKGCNTWNKGKTASIETRKKLAESHITSVFGKAFKEHYGLTKNDDIKLYCKEYYFYKRHCKFSWEVK